MEKSPYQEILVKQTAQFILQDPTDIVLIPRGKSETSRGAGGGLIRSAGTPRQPQTVKLISQGGSGINSGEGGIDRTFEYVIVGTNELEIEIGDGFKVDGQDFRVTAIAPDNGYEVKAYAIQKSERPTDG